MRVTVSAFSALTLLCAYGCLGSFTDGNSQSASGTRAIQGQLKADAYSLDNPVVIAQSADQKQFVRHVYGDGSFNLAVPTGTSYRLLLANTRSDGSYQVISHINWPADSGPMPWATVGDGDTLDLGQVHPVSQSISSFEHHCGNDLGSCDTDNADGGKSDGDVCGDGGMHAGDGDDGAHDRQRDRNDEHADHADGGVCDGGACRMHGDQDCENDHAGSCHDGNNVGESECDGPHHGASDGGMPRDAGMMPGGAHYADLDCHQADSHEQAVEKEHDVDCRCRGSATPARDAGAPSVAAAGACVTNADCTAGQSCINSSCQASTLPAHP